MAGKQQSNRLKRRVFKSYLTTTVSIAMVLFLVGLLGVVLLNAERLAKYVRENIGVSLGLKGDVQDQDIKDLMNTRQATKF